MTDLRQAAQQALEALENHEGNYKLTDAQCVRVDDAITALSEALAQPEQEPVAWMSQANNFLSPREFTTADAALYGWTPVYTTPPAAQRPWVGLTDEEQQQAYEQWQNDGWGVFYNAIEAKLKERNGY